MRFTIWKWRVYILAPILNEWDDGDKYGQWIGMNIFSICRNSPLWKLGIVYDGDTIFNIQITRREESINYKEGWHFDLKCGSSTWNYIKGPSPKFS